MRRVNGIKNYLYDDSSLETANSFRDHLDLEDVSHRLMVKYQRTYCAPVPVLS